MKRVAFVAALLLVPATVGADVKFTRLSEDQFIIHHRKKTTLGAEAKAMTTLYGEAASVCVAAGFSHMEIKSQEVGERHYGSVWGGGRGASGTVHVRFHHEEGEDLIACEPLADSKKIQVAKQKLAKEAAKGKP